MKKIVFLFGRFQVPTRGHAEMIRYGINLAKKSGAEFRLYTSQLQDSKKNPLPYHTKIMYLRMLFPGVNVVHDKSASSAFQICKKLSAEGYEDVTMVVGADRVQEFQTQKSKYVKDRNDPDFDPSKHYAFKNFRVVNSGSRKTGVSGTDMRNHIRKGDFNKFLQGIPTSNKELARSIFRTAKGFLKEEVLEEARKFEPLRMRTASSGSIASHIKHRSILDHPSIRTPKKAKVAIKQKVAAAIKSWEKYKKGNKKPSSSYNTFSFKSWKQSPESSHLASSPPMGSSTQFRPSWLNTDDPKLWNNFKFPKTKHSTKSIKIDSFYKIMKNPSSEEFDKMIQKFGDVRILRANGDWYVWKHSDFVHYQVIEKLNLAPRGMDMPHVNAADNKIPKGMIGVALESDKKKKVLTVDSDVIWGESMSWVLDEMKKDTRFKRMTKNWNVNGVHDVVKERKPKKTKHNMTLNQLKDKIQRDIDLNLSESKKWKIKYIPEWIHKNPSSGEFNYLIKRHEGLRLIELNGDWFVWDSGSRPSGFFHAHADALEKLLGIEGSDTWRKKNKILGFTLEYHQTKPELLHWWSDVEPNDSRRYLKELTNNIKFRKMTKDFGIMFPTGDIIEKGGFLKPKPKSKSKMSITQLKTKIKRDINQNLAETHSTRELKVDRPYIRRGKNKYKVLKNPNSSQFDDIVTLKGSVRIMKDKGDWYVWGAADAIHGSVLLDVLGYDYPLQHVNDAVEKKRNGLIGIELQRIGDETLSPYSDIISPSSMDHIITRLKKDKKFTEMTKNWNINEVHSKKTMTKKHTDSNRYSPEAIRATRAKMMKKFAAYGENISEGKIRRLPSSIFPSDITKTQPKVQPKKYESDTTRSIPLKIQTIFDTFKLRIKRNPSTEYFTNAIHSEWDGVSRFLWAEGNWYFWNGLEGNHISVYSQLKLHLWDQRKMYDTMPHVQLTKERMADSMYGAVLTKLDNFSKVFIKAMGAPLSKIENQNNDKLYVIHDQFTDEDLTWIRNRLKKDKKFIQITKNFHVVGVHDHGRPEGSKQRKPKKGLSKQQLRSRVKRDIDMNLAEEVSRKDFHKMLKTFIQYTSDDLGIDELPKIQYKEEGDQGSQPSFGGYQPSTKTLTIMTKNRHPMDIFRTVAHELVHHKQNLEGRLGHSANEGSDGSEIENEANSRAAVTMRRFGKANPDMFQQSYVTESLLGEGIQDKGIFKAIFLAGGVGSGKDYIFKKCIQGTGLRELNSDQAFEFLLKKNNIPLTMKDDNPLRNIVRGQAKNINMKQKMLQLRGRLGVVVNGTADDYTKISTLKKSYEELGYDTMMVFVGTSNKTSRQRNISRGQEGGREVPETIRFQKWMGSNKNKDRFRQLFGDNNFIYVDNSTDLRVAPNDIKNKVKKDFIQVYKRVMAFVNKPIVNPKTLEWIANEKSLRGISEMDEKFTDMLNEVGGAGNWGTGKLTGRYQRETPGQTVGFHAMKVLDMKTLHKKKDVKEETPVIKTDRIGPEYGYPKNPTLGDNQTIPYTDWSDNLNDPVSKWMVKEETKRKFRERYGALAEQRLQEAAKKFNQVESLDDPYSPTLGVTPNSWNQEDNRPGNVDRIDAEKQSLFGFKLHRKRKTKTK